MLWHRRLLRRVQARWALKRHALHLRPQVGPLLLLGLLRWHVRLVAADSAGNGDRVAVVDGRFVTSGGEFLRVAGVEGVDAVGADLALEAALRGRSGVGALCGGLLGGGFAAYD